MNRVNIKACLLSAVSLLWSVFPATLLGEGDPKAPQTPAVNQESLIGSTYDSLTVGRTTYRHVEVRGLNARTLIIAYDGGIASILLRQLSPELQARFGYSMEAETAAEHVIAQARSDSELKRRRDSETRLIKKQAAQEARFGALLRSFGQPVQLRSDGVDMRARFNELELGVKNQGRRPSCSIFAVVSALEYQNAELIGQAEKLSEEYLIWATCQTLNRAPTFSAAADAGAGSDENAETIRDEGFSLGDVVTALRAYGIPLQSSLPNTFGTGMRGISVPPREVVEDARNRCQVHVHSIPGRDNATRIANILHALNAGVPVAIGVRWPHERTLRSGFLNQQNPVLNYAHAVTLVGYQCKSGQAGDLVFIFKNSYGVNWGAGGYGVVSAAYLNQWLLDAVVLELERN